MQDLFKIFGADNIKLVGGAVRNAIRKKVTNDLDLAVNIKPEKVKEIPYHYISVAGKSFDEIIGIARRWLFKHVGYNDEGRMNDCLIIYDYRKLMLPESINNNVAECRSGSGTKDTITEPIRYEYVA